MPWRGPDYPNEFPTLGHGVARWIEARCAVPDGDRAGEPFLLTSEQELFLLHFYRLDPETGLFHYPRGAQLRRPQKWGKSPFAAAVVCAEGQGPVLFDGWDAKGDPVGRPWATPWIQIAGVSEDQTDNTWRALQPMIELGSIRAEIPDTGLTRINLPGGGRIEPVTSNALSRLGQRTTFAINDQAESWTKENKGRKLADTMRRGIAGMGGRWLETVNAWDPTERSVAQETAEGDEGGILLDSTECPDTLSIRNKAERRRALRMVYGQSMSGDSERKIKGWVNIDRIESEINALVKRDPAQAERFFLNRIRATESVAFASEKINKALVPEDTRPKKGALVVVGVDGARFNDALAVIGTEVETGLQWPIAIEQVPASPPDDYEHDFAAVDGAVSEADEDYFIWRGYVDPQWIEPLLEKWQGRWGDKNWRPWYTNRPRPMAFAVRNYTSDINTGNIKIARDPLFVQHLRNAQRQKVNVYDDDHRQMYVIGKEAPDSPRKMDGAAAGVLSWEARGDAIAADAKPKKRGIAFM